MLPARLQLLETVGLAKSMATIAGNHRQRSIVDAAKAAQSHWAALEASRLAPRFRPHKTIFKKGARQLQIWLNLDLHSLGSMQM